MLTVAAGVGEKFLRIPRFEDEKEQFMNFIRNLRSEHEDDHDILLNVYENFRKNQISVFGDEMRFISNLSLKRIGRVRSSLDSQLRQLLPFSPSSESSKDRKSILKILSLCAFYPDMAFKMSRRNQYLLPGAISAEVQKESMQFVESLEAVLSNGNDGQEFNSKGSAKALVFEELFDAGHSMIVRTCKVDPVFSVLFADSVLILQKTIYVDNWIRITSYDPNSLELLLELRELWKSLTRKVLSTNNSKRIDKLRKLITSLSNLWNPERPLEIK